jgi:hypothetical protein
MTCLVLQASNLLESSLAWSFLASGPPDPHNRNTIPSGPQDSLVFMIIVVYPIQNITDTVPPLVCCSLTVLAMVTIPYVHVREVSFASINMSWIQN